MRNSFIIIAALCAAGLAFWAIFAPNSSSDAPAASTAEPRLEKFTPANPPKPAPTGRVIAADGTEKTLAEWRGKYVLINFWATWCAPCVSEMPSLLRLQKAMGGDKFTVLAVSEDLKGWPVIGPFLERLSLKDLPAVHDPQGATARDFGVSGLPATILIDPTGLVLGRVVGPAEWDGEAAKATLRAHMKTAVP
jgi:thiol-disulfide isomerase/thioredoxin